MTQKNKEDEPLGEDIQNMGNLFLDYVSQSTRIKENISAIAAKEERRLANAWGYTAEIADIREQMMSMRNAFKEIVNSYAPLLPKGWRVIADYDKWVAGRACAGFLHGEIQPDITLMIGGRCSTVADLELELDRLFRYVNDISY